MKFSFHKAAGLGLLPIFCALMLLAPEVARAGGRRGQLQGNFSAGVSSFRGDAGIVIGGAMRYYLTNHVALGPSVTVTVTDPATIYNLRGLLRIGTYLVEKSTPLEVYLEAGAGALITDWEQPSLVAPVPVTDNPEVDLVIPFGGGINWEIHRNFSLSAGILLNVSTNDSESFFPEYYGGLRFAFE